MRFLENFRMMDLCMDDFDNEIHKVLLFNSFIDILKRLRFDDSLPMITDVPQVDHQAVS